MCLGVPGRVIEVRGAVASVDFFGVNREVRLELVEQPVATGYFILKHVGYAIRRIPHEEIQETLSLYEQLLRQAAADDLMASDVRAEVQATGVQGDGDR